LPDVLPVRRAGLADLNADDKVDFKDFAVLVGQWVDE